MWLPMYRRIFEINLIVKRHEFNPFIISISKDYYFRLKRKMDRKTDRYNENQMGGQVV